MTGSLAGGLRTDEPDRMSQLSVVLGWQRGGEEVGEELCHALGLVVMHPVRRAEQALNTVQVGHVVVVGHRLARGEVMIARRQMIRVGALIGWAKRCFGTLARVRTEDQ